MSARTRWVAIIVGLLVGNAAAVGVLIGLSSGETRHRVLPDYYQRAVAWDATMAAAQASADLGWRADVAVRGRDLMITIVDRDRRPVTDAVVELTAVPRGHVDAATTAAATAIGAGVYRAVIAGDRRGLHDVALRVGRGEQRFLVDRLVDVDPVDGAPP